MFANQSEIFPRHWEKTLEGNKIPKVLTLCRKGPKLKFDWAEIFFIKICRQSVHPFFFRVEMIFMKTCVDFLVLR